ncbi:hypothetical protein RND71_019130 [Anisodus tanguticus]|uniref:Uncharacterized protein n=1 Tax=Anisodus tanguticus TaxID=243964 RepID=A0AAE1RYF3_9SOLA|nr:hypothetical protein RND71_019130 [Anisodus tanguticus]
MLELEAKQPNFVDTPRRSKIVLPHQNKGLPCEDVQKKKSPTQAHQASKKRPSQDESDSRHGDCNFKRMRACPSSLEDINSSVVEISDSVGSLTRTVTTHIKEEHLDLVLNEKDKKAEELSVASRSYKEAKKKADSLRARRDAAKKEVEEIESKVSSTEEEYRRCADVFVVAANDSADVKEKRRHLEASLQNLVNYKLCLD